jgi:hypothetical protein
MSDLQFLALLFIGPVLLYLNRKKKEQNWGRPQEMVYFEMIETIDVRRSRKVPVFVINMAIVAVILAVIWIMSGA